MKERNIRQVGVFRHKVDKGGRLTSHHAKMLLEIAEIAIAENVSLQNRILIADSAASAANESSRKANKDCDALRSNASRAMDAASADFEKERRKWDAERDKFDNLLAVAGSKVESLETKVAELEDKLKQAVAASTENTPE